MSGSGLSKDFPPNIQAVLAVTEEGDGCVVCVELEALIQTRRSLGAAALDWQAAPSFDRRAVEAHVSLLHDLVEGLDGVLILAAFEEGAMPNVQRFKIGDVANMVETIMGFDGHPRVNLYIPWAVMRRDLEPRKKGAEADVVAALAAVGDIDGDKGVKTELPVEAPYIVESSPGNFQPVYIFDRPLAAADAKPVLTALCDFVGGDSATKDCSHVWRIPGTLNIPTKSKLARGRSSVPAPVSIKKQYDGGFVSPAALLALAPPPRLPNGHDTAPSGPPSFAEEARLRGALKVILPDDRDIWLKVGAALHLVGARAVWDDWSKTSGKFDADDQDRVWASFHAKRKEGVVTIATIYAWAKERGWNPAAAEQWTELGNAHRLVRRHGDDVRYVHPLKAWFIWDGVYWRRDDSGEIMRRAEATIEAIFDEAKEITDEAIRAALRKFALKSQARAQISAMVQLAQHQLRVVLSPGALDASPMLLGVLNGTIDLKACAFREGRRQDYITKQCAVAFDPQAQCPNWIEFQNKIAGGNAELVAYKQRVFGLLLTGEMVEILFILHGDGQNGKTTELETISGVLGDYAHAADAKILLAANDRGGATPEIVAIKGKRAIFINETDGSDHLNESRVNVRSVYLESGQPTPVADGNCKFFFSKKNISGIACGAEIDEAGRRTVPIVSFDADRPSTPAPSHSTTAQPHAPIPYDKSGVANCSLPRTIIEFALNGRGGAQVARIESNYAPFRRAARQTRVWQAGLVDQDGKSLLVLDNGHKTRIMVSLPDGKGLAFSAEGGVSDILCQVLVSP